jgi:succinate-semialdehyde dehydrogenase / glutarate-semialdehyde dehydrogenase
MSTIDTARLIDQVPTQLYIGGAWRAAADGRTLEVEDPATRTVLREVADASAVDGTAAVDAAAAAQDDWAATAPRTRGELLRRVHEAILEQADDLAVLLTLEMGKPLAEARSEVVYAAEFFRWFSEEAVRIRGSYSIAPSGANRALTMKQPVGPSVFVTPWNFPIAMGARKIAPALAAGCTTIVKPAQQTPLTMLALARILEECGAPAGVVNVVPTRKPGEVVDAILEDDRIRKLSFTGSTAVGKLLMRKAADRVLRVSLELGGNAPFIVCADADIENAVDGAMLAKMRNIGQACTAANRFFVERPVANEFADALAARFANMKVGAGLDDGIDVGPLIDLAALEKVEELVADSLAKGATATFGGGRTGDGGYFYQPTVLVDVPRDAAMRHDEIFGPVASISPFDDDASVIAEANDTPYGLVSYVYTESLQRALTFAERLESGMVGLNRGIVSDPSAPFGGVKESGLGREGGAEGIDEFLSLKLVSIA